MEMAGKQLSQFMELLVQPRLTVCATASYGLWKWLASSYPNLWNCLCNRVLRLVQLRLTASTTASYGLWKWLASSYPIYGNGFRSGTSENQRLHKELGNSEIRLHTDLGNSRTELHLNKNWWNCDRNLRQSAPIGRKSRRNFPS